MSTPSVTTVRSTFVKVFDPRLILDYSNRGTADTITAADISNAYYDFRGRVTMTITAATAGRATSCVNRKHLIFGINR